MAAISPSNASLCMSPVEPTTNFNPSSQIRMLGESRCKVYDIMSLVYVRRFWLAGLVLVAVVALLPFSFHAEQHLETATRIEGSEAETVSQELTTRFRSPFV